MTAQVPDSISIDGNKHMLCVLPLERLFAAMPNPPLFEPQTTANWRGYAASWKIENQRLWLIGLRGRLQNKPGRVERGQRSFENPKDYYQSVISRIETLPQGRFGIRHSDENWSGHLIDDENGVVDLDAASRITIDELLRSDATPVHASWYSGLLRIPTGELLNYIHGGFGSGYQTDLIIEIDAGMVRRQWVIDNKPSHEARKRKEAIEQKSLLAFRDPHDVLKKAFVKSMPKTQGYNLLEGIHQLLRTHFLKQVAGSEVMSREDQNARTAYEKAVATFDEARLAIGMTISLRRTIADEVANLSKMPLSDFAFIMHMKTEYCERARTLLCELKIPSGDQEQIEWATENIRSAKRLIKEENFALLGTAHGIVSELPNLPSIGDPPPDGQTV